MAYRKDKPALYELLRQGNLKPTREGRMSTPRWFYSGRAAGEKKAATETGPRTASENGPAGGEPRAKAPSPVLQKTPATASEPWRIELSLTRQVVILAGVGLLITHLAAFMLGQSGQPSPEATSQHASVSVDGAQPVEVVRQAPVRENIYPDAKLELAARQSPKVTRPSQASLQVQQPPAMQNSVAPEQSEPQPVIATELPKEGICLIFCGYGDPRELRPVQEYFNKNGIASEIGKPKDSSRYVLYTRAVFDSRHNAALDRVKSAIAELGVYYNQNKPRTALPFNAETFAGAYPANVQDIVNLNAEP